MDLRIFDFDYYEKDNAAKNVRNYFESLLSNYDGLWLYREPEMKTEGDELPTFTILSQDIGLIFVKCYDYSNDNIKEINDKYWNIDNQQIKSPLIYMRNYTHKIKSKIEDPIFEIDNVENIPIYTIYIFPYISKISSFDNAKKIKDEFIYCADNLDTIKIIENKIDITSYKILISIIQNSHILNKTSNIYIPEPAKNMSEAIILNERKIAQFDFDQMKASMTITEKSERIRGLAGSGKTVLLAMKAAKLHKRNPDKKIAFIFYTKSLYSQVTGLIRKYYYQLTDDEPNWDNLKILHSWGGKTTGEGFYSNLCENLGIRTKIFNEITYDKACEELLQFDVLPELFDYILVDEAQDFPLSFFKLIQKIAKNPKKIVIAYDELQTTNDTKLPEFDELFGTINGIPNIQLEPEYDYILKKSYRNTINVLITAFAFGFGFYHDITQIIQDEDTWHALGFEVYGNLEPNENIIITRPNENSPNSVADIFPSEIPVQAFIAENDQNVAIGIVSKLVFLIYQQNVKAKDILVIDINMNKTHILEKIQYLLYEQEIESHIPGFTSDAREFIRDNMVTLTTPRNAKGNEVPIVFVTGCENIYGNFNISTLRKKRNLMFISISRSKGWVYLYASGRVKTNFIAEYKNIIKNIPNIIFDFPNEIKLKELAIIDLITKNPAAKKINENVDQLKKLVKTNDTNIFKELLNLDPEFKKLLKQIIED